MPVSLQILEFLVRMSLLAGLLFPVLFIGFGLRKVYFALKSHQYKRMLFYLALAACGAFCSLFTLMWLALFLASGTLQIHKELEWGYSTQGSYNLSFIILASIVLLSIVYIGVIRAFFWSVTPRKKHHS